MPQTRSKKSIKEEEGTASLELPDEKPLDPREQHRNYMRRRRQQQKQEEAFRCIPEEIPFETAAPPLMNKDLKKDFHTLVATDFVDVKCNNDPFKYHKEFAKMFSIRATTVMTTHFIEPETNNKRDMMRMRKNSKDHILQSKLKRSNHYRKYLIEIEMEGKWFPLFEIKKSTLPDAGLGLFAAQDFARDDVLGVYAGKVKSEEAWQRLMVGKRDCYGYHFTRGKRDHVLDPTILNSDPSDMLSYFGLHYANDPTWLLKKDSDEYNEAMKKVNMEINTDLVASTKKFIKKGEELFNHYKFEKKKEMNES